MTKKFGGEYELKDVEVKTSTVEARRLFFELIREMKPSVAINLIELFNFEAMPVNSEKNGKQINSYYKIFLYHTKNHSAYSVDLSEFGFKPEARHTPLLAYFDFFFKNQAEYEEILLKKEKEWQAFKPNPKRKLIVETALSEMIPNWKSLQAKSSSELLCETLAEWAKRWNLMEDWCLDFALNCLRNCKVDFIDKLNLPENYLQSDGSFAVYEFQNYWQTGAAWRSSIINMIWEQNKELVTSDKIPKFQPLEYVWKQDYANDQEEIFQIIDSYNPFYSTESDFRRRVEEDFLSKFFGYYSNRSSSFNGKLKTLAKEIENFQNRVDVYVSANNSKAEPFAHKTVSKRDGDKHFRWLIDFQLPPAKTYENIAGENNIDNKAVRAGIGTVAKIIKLNLRKAQRTGRPKGVKEVKERRNYTHW